MQYCTRMQGSEPTMGCRLVHRRLSYIVGGNMEGNRCKGRKQDQSVDFVLTILRQILDFKSSRTKRDFRFSGRRSASRDDMIRYDTRFRYFELESTTRYNYHDTKVEYGNKRDDTITQARYDIRIQ